MNEKCALKILEINRESYEKIGTRFSDTRNYVWKDFDVFKKYIRSGIDVIDIGCGNGRASSFFEGNECSYTGIDGSVALLSEAKKKFPNHIFFASDLLMLNTQKELFLKQYDVACCFAVLNHFPHENHWKTILQNVCALVKPQGYLFMTNWNLWNITSKKGFWQLSKERVFFSNAMWKKKYGMPKSAFGLQDIPTLWQSGNISAMLYYYSFRMKQLASLVRHAGFEIIESRYIKNGTPAHWWNGTNSAIVARKI